MTYLPASLATGTGPTAVQSTRDRLPNPQVSYFVVHLLLDFEIGFPSVPPNTANQNLAILPFNNRRLVQLSYILRTSQSIKDFERRPTERRDYSFVGTCVHHDALFR